MHKIFAILWLLCKNTRKHRKFRNSGSNLIRNGRKKNEMPVRIKATRDTLKIVITECRVRSIIKLWTYALWQFSTQFL